MSPDRIGPYRIEAQIGQGGMGVVYRAVGNGGQKVALKAIRGALRSDALVKRFLREATIRIAHPNVARVIDAGTDEDGAPYIALELLDGETLAQRFARGRPTPTELIAWGRAACAGLAAAHAQRVVHRDVKPSNVFLCRGGAVKVLDFGVALLDAERLTHPEAVPGTVGYLSPEQARGRVDVDARSDVWSLAAVLYEGLTGQRPFERETALATVVAALVADLTPIRELAPDVPAPIATVVERALRRDREARYPNMDAFAAALSEAERADVEDRNEHIPAGERRVVALVLAAGVRDVGAFEERMREQAGTPLRVGERHVAIFGAERSDGSELERAARAAIAARPAAERIGLAYGWAASGGRGVTGEALEAAERCLGAAAVGVAIDAESARALGSSFAIVPAAGGIFELREPARVGAEEIALVAREAETTQLAAALRAVLVDRTALVATIAGPPGIGKSRLLRWVEARARTSAEHALVARVDVSPRSREQDLSLVRALARDVFPSAAAADIELRLRADFGAARARALAVTLAAWLSSDATADAIDVGVARDRIRVALREWLTAEASRGLILLIDDLDRADTASIELLEDVVDEARERPLLIVSTTAEDPRAFEGRDVVSIEPRALTRADVATLVEHIAGRDLAPSLIDAIAERSGGNPFFVVQLTRGAIDQGQASIALPRTIEATIQSRLDRLPEAERALCRRASVWGRAFTLDEARAVGVDDPEVAIAALARRDLLITRGRRRGVSSQLKSALVAEVAYASLDDALRIELHRAAAAHLATVHDADPEERARHHALGGQDEAAAIAYDLAAHAAIRRGDAQSALRCAERALGSGATGRAFELHALRIDALRFLGRRDEQQAALDACLAAARDAAQRATALSERAVWLSRRGQSDEAIACAAEASALAKGSSDAKAIFYARGRESLVLHAVGRASEARVALDEAVALSKGFPLALRAIALGWRAIDVSARGHLDERLALFAEHAEVYEQIGDLRRGAGARANLADVYNRLGAYADSIEALEVALLDCRRVGHAAMEGYVALNLGYAKTALDRVEQALADLAVAEEIATKLGEARLLGLVRVYRARTWLRAGSHRHALEEAERALSIAVSMPDLEVAALTIASRAHLALGDTERALERSDAAFAKYETLDAIEEDEADVFLARAVVLRAVGRSNEADVVVTRGRAAILRIANGISDPVLRQRFLRDVPAHAALFG